MVAAEEAWPRQTAAVEPTGSHRHHHTYLPPLSKLSCDSRRKLRELKLLSGAIHLIHWSSEGGHLIKMEQPVLLY